MVPKGTVLVEVGKLLERGSPETDENGKIVRDKNGKVVYEPYKIKVLNTINFKKSMHYNPFVYIRSEKDILKLVTTIIANTKGEGQQSGEDFWVKAEKLYYCALIGYIWYEGREEEKNFNTLLALINASEAREDDENFKNPVDLMFEELEAEKPEHFAVRQYKKYKLAAGKTAKSILISCGARLAPFDVDLYNTSDTRGQSRSYGLNYQKTGKELMSRDELAVMDGNKCILQLRGVRPFFSDKFDITRHKRYKQLSDYDKRNAFDVEAHMKHQLKLRMKEEFDLFEVDGSENEDMGENSEGM